MSEEWKNVIGYEGYYQVSNKGNVRSVDRLKEHNTSHSGFIPIEGQMLKQSISHKGYPIVYLSKSGKDKTVPVHRLVAITFIPNPDNLPQVNHIDGDKTNNNAENLEWCDNSYNQIHAYKMGLHKVSEKAGRPRKPVMQIDKDTNEIVNIFVSLAEAERQTGCYASRIRIVCNGEGFTTGGYKWKYLNNKKESDVNEQNKAFC